MKKIVLLLVIAGLTPTLLVGQIEMTPSVISSSGGYSENGDFSISWTFGELAITTLHEENVILTQGFQQHLNIGTGIKKDEVTWYISVYPNPVQNELKIHFDLKELNDFLLEIQDVTGRIMIQESHKNVSSGDIVILNLSDLVSGVYFLKILTTDFQQVKVTSLRKL